MPSSIFLPQNILNLINDIHSNINERISTIKNRNIEINKEIYEKFSTFRSNQYELFTHLMNKFENVSTDENNNSNDSESNHSSNDFNNGHTNDNNENNHTTDTIINENDHKAENINNEASNENISGSGILYETFSLLKKRNMELKNKIGSMELLNRIESSVIYNINFLHNEFNHHDDQEENREIINFTNSNGENKTLLYPKITEIFNEHDLQNTSINNSHTDISEEKLIKKEENHLDPTEIKKENVESSSSVESSFDHLKVNEKMKKCSSSSSFSSFKRLMRMTGISKLPYLGSMIRMSDDEEIKSPSESKNRKSMGKKKDINISINITDADIINQNDHLLYPSNETIDYDGSNKALKSSASAEFKLNKNRRKSHTKSYSENINLKYNMPLPISNTNSKKKNRLSAPVSFEKDLGKEKIKEKEKEMEKLRKEKEKEMEKLRKEKEKEMEKLKKEKEKEKNKKELHDKKKKTHKTNLQKTNSLLEIERRLKNVFDNYNVKLIGRESSSHPILTNAIADKILPNITPSMYKEYRNWKLLYSLDCHGTHIQTMYDSVFEKSPLVIAIMDEDGCIFGAYSTDYFRSETHYYGNGQTFLWKYTINENGIGTLNYYKATGSNHYYMISEKDYIAFGGGKGFGLHLSDHFSYGFTDNCETYNNDVLACKKEFKCLNVEIWCLDL